MYIVNSDILVMTLPGQDPDTSIAVTEIVDHFSFKIHYLQNATWCSEGQQCQKQKLGSSEIKWYLQEIWEEDEAGFCLHDEGAMLALLNEKRSIGGTHMTQFNIMSLYVDQ